MVFAADKVEPQYMCEQIFTYGLWGSDIPVNDQGTAGLQRAMRRMNMNVLIASPGGAALTPEYLDKMAGNGIQVIPYCGWEEMEKTIRPEVKDHPSILGWYVRDEPPTDFLPEFLERCEVIKKLTPDKPALCLFYMPDAASEFAPHQPVLLTDSYPLCYQHDGTSLGPHFAHHRPDDPLTLKKGMGRYAPYGVYGVMDWMNMMNAYAGANKPHWVTLQTFESGNGKWVRWIMPSQSELRLMAYYAIAGGAKGINYFRYSCFMDDYGLPLDGNHAEYGKLYEEIVRLGDTLVPMGPLFIDAESAEVGAVIPAWRPSPEPGARVEYRRLRSKSRNIDYFVVFNNDVQYRGSADIVLRDDFLGERKIYDLNELCEVATEQLPQGKLFKEEWLEPGGGKIIAVAAPEDYSYLADTIRSNRCRSRARIFDIDYQLAKSSKVKLEGAEKYLTLYRQAFDDGDYVAAERRLLRAGVELNTAIGNDPEFQLSGRLLENLRFALAKNPALSAQLNTPYCRLLDHYWAGQVREVLPALQTMTEITQQLSLQLLDGVAAENLVTADESAAELARQLTALPQLP